MSTFAVILIACIWACTLGTAWCLGALWWNRKFTDPALEGWFDTLDTLGEAIEELRQSNDALHEANNELARR